MRYGGLAIALWLCLALSPVPCAAAASHDVEKQRELIEDICASYEQVMDSESNEITPGYERERARLDVLMARWKRLYPSETRFEVSLCAAIARGWTWPPGAWTWPPAKPSPGCKKSPDKGDPCAAAKESTCRDSPGSVECRAYTNMLSHSLCGGPIAQIAREQCASLSKMEKERHASEGKKGQQ